ncbi:MAG: sugar ABC transporter permease [Clostridiales bacterium]|nr:sugar ABC transporter permease [Clostridiales bacterium]HBM81126.1 ABC transporter permease [Clostridiaceae bacterium]
MKSKFKKWWKKYYVGYLFLLPFVVLFVIFVIIPVLVALGTSFTNYNMLQRPKWIGLTNYKLLFLDDDVFLIALKNTFVFACITGPIGYFMSLFAAWVINQLRFRKGFALAFYAPSITSGVAMSVVWLYFFSGDRYGLINNILINFGIIKEPILWTMDAKYIMPVIIVISIWMSMGTGFLVFLAGLQNIPKELYEAGAIDGIKNKFQELVYITLPMMKPQLLFGAINSVVGSFGVFDIAVSVAGMPSPNYAAHTIVAHLYDYAFIRFEMGYASAISMVLFCITFVFGRLLMKLLSSKDM